VCTDEFYHRIKLFSWRNDIEANSGFDPLPHFTIERLLISTVSLSLNSSSMIHQPSVNTSATTKTKSSSGTTIRRVALFEYIKVVRPPLHHQSTRRQMCRPVVRASIRVLDGMRELVLN
jgi:hypothetical protein